MAQTSRTMNASKIFSVKLRNIQMVAYEALYKLKLKPVTRWNSISSIIHCHIKADDDILKVA